MNLMFSCSPSGFTIQAGCTRKLPWLWAWVNRLIANHQKECPYCQFEKDLQTGREVGA